MNWIDIVQREGEWLAAAARHDLSARVPACPGWAAEDVVKHLASTHRWCATILRERCTEMPPYAGPPDDVAPLDWFDEGLAALTATMRDIDPATPVWTFAAGGTASFWLRRMAHETTVHRVDAEQAATADAVAPIAPEFAADGIAEALAVTATRRAPRHATAGGTLHLHTTDTEGEWLLRFRDGALDVETGHAKGDAAVRGAAADIYLWLWGRDDGSALEVFGDAALPDRLLQLTRI